MTKEKVELCNLLRMHVILLAVPKRFNVYTVVSSCLKEFLLYNDIIVNGETIFCIKHNEKNQQTHTL